MKNESKTHCDACKCAGVVTKPGIIKPLRLADLERCDVCDGDNGGWDCDVCEVEDEMAADEERMNQNERS